MFSGQCPISNQEIENWVKEHHGFVPASCWLAHCKELLGFEVRKAHNRQCPRKKPCPTNKQKPIFEAIKFLMKEKFA